MQRDAALNQEIFDAQDSVQNVGGQNSNLLSHQMDAPAWLKSFRGATKAKAKRQLTPPVTEDPQGAAASQPPESEDADFMSNALLVDEAAKLPASKKQAVSKTKPLKEIMSDALQEGLVKPINQDNVGFKMLSKMGFREGTGLGKDGLGIAEPIEINFSKGRAGLGVEEEQRRQLQEMIDEQKRTESTLRTSFLNHQKRSFEANQIARELEKAQKSCQQLDLACGITKSSMWECLDPNEGASDPGKVERSFRDVSGMTYVKTNGDVDQNRSRPVEDVETMTLRFRGIVQYLKERHIYCHYCSTRFNTPSALEAYCRTDEDCAALFDLD